LLRVLAMASVVSRRLLVFACVVCVVCVLVCVCGRMCVCVCCKLYNERRDMERQGECLGY
jgi:hypothetical protein